MPMNDYRIILTGKAKHDIISIGDYITYTLLEPATSKKFIKGLRKSISQLQFFPYKYPLVQDELLQYQKIRCMPYKNFYIFYTVREDEHTVAVLRVGYNRKNWKNILS